MQHHEWYIERERLLGRIEELEAENAELRKRLGEGAMPIVRTPTAMLNRFGHVFLQHLTSIFRNQLLMKRINKINL